MPAVVGMASQNRQRPIDLFGNDDLRERMWQSHSTQRQQKVSLRSRTSRPAISRSHSDHHLLLSAIARPSHELRELPRTQGPPSAIEENKQRSCPPGPPLCRRKHPPSQMPQTNTAHSGWRGGDSPPSSEMELLPASAALLRSHIQVGSSACEPHMNFGSSPESAYRF